ncbi:MAG TPA: DUF1553 domain-containing protein [Pirellulales bacterium]|nr:DUF1553 domain-containing protein [Pirellulales bacterium]
MPTLIQHSTCPPRLPLLLLVIAGLAAQRSAYADQPSAQTEFNRDIRPILADNCFKCHGPDAAQRKGDLRLDMQADAVAERDGGRVIVPGDAAMSEVYRRLTATDAEERMPPPDSGKTLTAAQIDLLRRWIDEGAAWQSHWSLISPARSATPAVKQAEWLRNAIDHFILARLEREGLPPSPEADRAILLRRVTLDLTGLPPTPAEVDAFLADPSPDAYERAVDRLLASPRYGERMAVRWLDAARYADTNGYQTDGERIMWRWRDWVIDAYNRNLPFDQFTLEQLAGDLLPGCTLDQQIATGFNRNHRGNAEGGIIPEEFAVEYVVDRVDTTATVWLGLTLACARCHDHKFDPFTQREYYQLFAYFNQVPERGKAVKYGNSPPVVSSPTPIQQRQLEELDRQLAAAEQTFNQYAEALAAAQTEWEASLAGGPTIDWSPSERLAAYFPFDGDDKVAPGLVPGGSDVAPQSAGHKGRDYPPGGGFATGRVGQAMRFDGQAFIDAGDVAPFGFYDKFTISAWVRLGDERSGTIVSRMTDEPQADGYYLVADAGKIQLNLVKRWLDDALRVQTARALDAGRWHHVAATYDGSRVAAGVKIYLDGQPEPLEVLLDELNQSFNTKQPLRIGGGGGPEARFHGSLDEVRLYRRQLADEDVQVLATADSVDRITQIAPTHRTAGQIAKMRAYFLATAAPPAIRDAWQRVGELRQQRTSLVETFPTTMVMRDMPQPRDTFLLIRGQYNQPGERVSPGVPGALSPLPSGVPNNRLGLARWLVDPQNPLTARVAVNRLWQMLFGIGLVKTVDDFGVQGEPPSHPELLDWLACEFIARGWDVKAMLRLMVTSATYRQSPQASRELRQRDPDNRLLARGPRSRLSADVVRDQALASAGLLIEQIGGPSVKPYQPEGLWQELSDSQYVQDHGEKLYRRSLYTFWKRTIPPPVMITFDAAGRETCIVRETRTNTPLQALALLNETGFVEAARSLAARAMREAGPDPRDRVAYLFRLVLARRPAAAELDALFAGYERHLAHYREQPQAAEQLLTVGESRISGTHDPIELAAYTAVAGVVLNLDEAVTKE